MPGQREGLFFSQITDEIGLAVQIADVDSIKVDEMQSADAASGQIDGDVGAETAEAGNGDGRGFDLFIDLRRVTGAKHSFQRVLRRQFVFGNDVYFIAVGEGRVCRHAVTVQDDDGVSGMRQSVEMAGRRYRFFSVQFDFHGLYIDIFTCDRLHAGRFYGCVHFVEGAVVADFKLFVALFLARLFQMAANADTNAGRDLIGGNFDDIVAEMGVLAARYGNRSEGQEESVGADDLDETPFVDIFRIDLIVVDDRPQTRAGEGDFGVRIFALHEPGVHARRYGVFLVIVETEESGEADAAHAAENGSLLRVEAVREDPFVSRQMQCFILIGVVRFLENGDVICAAFMEKPVFIDVYGIDFDADDAEILTGDPDGIADIGDVRHMTAFAGEHEDFFQSRDGDVPTFPVQFVVRQAGALDLIMRIETAVNAVIFAIIGEIDRREEIDGIAEVAACDGPGFAGHFLQMGQRRFR